MLDRVESQVREHVDAGVPRRGRQRWEGSDLSLLRDIAPDDNDGRYFQRFAGKPLNEATYEDIAKARPMADRAMAAETKGFLFLKAHSMVARHLGTPTTAISSRPATKAGAS